MKPTIKSQWIAALRSGDYKQGRKRLRQDNLYCCLGVLCDLHSKASPDDRYFWRRARDYEDCDENCYSYGDGMATALPDSVRHWAGLGYSGPVITVDGKVRTLALLNDEGYTFEQIAKIIEEHF